MAFADEDEEEAFYEQHRAQLLEELKKGGAERLNPRPDGCGVGLLNQGATCYMNSLLQALFYTPEFRLALYDWRYDAAAHGSADRSIPLQLQRLFAELQLSSVSASSTRAFTAACGMSDTGTQHDVQELCRVLFDALSQSSKPLAEKLNHLFSGKLEHYIRCAEERGSGDGSAPESRREEIYFDLQVQIQGCTSLEQALRQLVEPEMLDGDNQWFCEALGCKVDAKKGVSLKTLPSVLCLQLMRFIFDFMTMSRRKLNELVAIPLELDLAFLFEPGCAPANTKYALSAVCLHSGTTHSGHYRAYVQDETAAGQWFEANDAVVKVMDKHQRDRLFKLHTVDGEVAEGGSRVFTSSEAYFLVYRRIDGEAPHIDASTVPEPVRSEVLARNAALAGLQRAYAVHKKLVELKVYAPKASYIALRKHTLQNLSGLLATEDEEAKFDETLLSVTVNVSTARPIRYALQKAIAAFGVAAGACDDQEVASWALGLPARMQTGEVRLRRYDQWTGELKEPLEGASLDNPVEQIVSRFTGQLQGALILEMREAGQEYQRWHEEAGRVVLCRWDQGRGAIAVGPGSLQALRVPLPSGQERAAKAEAPAAAAPAEPEAEETPAFDGTDDMPDLFGDSAPTVNQAPQRDVSPALRDVRAAVAASMAVDAASLALVPLTGSAAGEPLQGDEARTLWQCNFYNTDVLCAEVAVAGAPLRSVELYDRVKNTATFSFNHPDRPEYTEEFTVSCSVNATIAQLKERIAAVLEVDASGIHLCRGPKAAQLKDETKSLRQANVGNIFVGKGPPCGVDENMLRVALYLPSEKGGPPRQRELFLHPGKGAGSVRTLRQALVEPLIRWHEKQPAAVSASDGGVGEKPAAGNDTPAFRVEGLTWKRLRLRDGQAGKQFAVLRGDDRTLRSALLGFSDLRQVAVQVLDHDEELTAEDLFLTLRTWKVHEGKLSNPVEEIVRKTQTLATFRVELAARFGPELFLPAAAPVAPNEPGEEPEAEAEVGKGQGGGVVAEPAPEEAGEEDHLELFTLPSASAPNVLQRLQTAKWQATRLNSADAVDAELPLSEFKELRDGAALVIRSARSAARGPPDTVDSGKGKGKGPKGPSATLADGIAAKAEGRAKGKAKSWPKVSVAAPSARRERGIVIQVATPEAAEGESVARKDGGGADGEQAPLEPAAEPSPREPEHVVH